MADVGARSDKALGTGLLLAAVAGMAAVLLFVASMGGDQVASGWSFGVAVGAASLAVLALHAEG